MKPSFRDLLFNPNTFFLNLICEKEGLKVPALILLAGGILSAVYGYYASTLTVRMMGNLMPGMGTIITISVIAGALIGTFIIWVIWAGVIHVISTGLGGKGTFGRTLQVIGYGYLPQLAGTALSMVIALEYVPKVTIPVISSTSDPEVIQESVKALMQDPAMHQLTMISSVIAILFLLWSANIWIFGIKNARQTTVRNSAISVGIPAVIYIIYLSYNLMVV